MNSFNSKEHSTYFTAPMTGARGRALLDSALREARDLLHLQPFVIAARPTNDGRYLVTFSDADDVRLSHAYA